MRGAPRRSLKLINGVLGGGPRPIQLRELSMITGQCRWQGARRHRDHRAGFGRKGNGLVVRGIHKVLTLWVGSKRTLAPLVGGYEGMTVTAVGASTVSVKSVT